MRLIYRQSVIVVSSRTDQLEYVGDKTFKCKCYSNTNYPTQSASSNWNLLEIEITTLSYEFAIINKLHSNVMMS